jgi:hypothetical protein
MARNYQSYDMTKRKIFETIFYSRIILERKLLMNMRRKIINVDIVNVCHMTLVFEFFGSV